VADIEIEITADLIAELLREQHPGAGRPQKPPCDGSPLVAGTRGAIQAGHNARMSTAAGPSGPRPFSTHSITLEEGIAVKRFRSAVEGDGRRLFGDEPRREWAALELLARYAPGLAPRPVRADLDSDPPVIAMSCVPGEPLGTGPVTAAQEEAVAAALSRLHHAIPPSVLARVERAPGSPQLIPGRIRDMARACDAESLEPMPRQAYRAALAWLDRGRTERPAPVTGQLVFAQGDPNLANHLWDGHTVHLVDFEASGRGDRTTELADFVEHVTVWAHARIDAESFIDRFDVNPGERRQITQLRRLFAAFWVMRLLPGGGAYDRNPPGTFERQASRLLELLGSAR
jgi:Phosphotransferase enzyme family